MTIPGVLLKPSVLYSILAAGHDRAKAFHMIRLKLPAEPYWLDLPYGVRVKVRPLTTAIAAAARARAARVVAELRDDFRRRKEAGVPLDGLPDLDDDSTAEGYAQQTAVQAFARAAIVEWQGVLLEDGKTPAPVTPETVGDLMRIDLVASAFNLRYGAPLDLLVAEGNASAPAPSGTSASGENTATGADTSEPPVPVASSG